MGVPVTRLPPVGVKAVVGFHIYVLAPVAVKVAVCCPTHIVELFTITGGKRFTVIVDVAAFVHPLATIPLRYS